MAQYRVLRVVVASPGDVKAERELVPHVIDEVNRNIAHKRDLHLDLYKWETDAHPGFHPLGPQGLIDPKLKIEDCDLLIGIFWRRFGTPVSDAKSGTEHEFRLAYGAWQKNKTKPQIFVYFSQRAYTPKTKKETEQWGLVLQFKEEFPAEGLWWDYKKKTEFGDFLRNHISQFVNDCGGEVEEKPPAQPPVMAVPLLAPLFQIPPPPPDFTGREAELRELREAIEKGGVLISGLQGQGGVGKTALALRLAADLAPRFPDAQIYLDLKGVSEKPLTTSEPLAHVVRSFHPEAKLREKEEELKGLFTSVLHGKRVLLLMDNARDAAQIQSLIPPQGSTLLVTSRRAFTLPGLKAKRLDTLPPGDAKDLLIKIAPRIGNTAVAMAKACGYLALALRLAATAIAEHADIDPADYLQRLADESKRLKLLPGVAGDPGMEASIALSYNLLSEETQRLWRMLGVFPDTFDAPAAASVWEADNEGALSQLSDLLRLSMLDWDDTAKRYRLHDLMRAFARGKTSEVEHNIGALRHAKHYVAVLTSADQLYERGGEAIMRGLAVFDLEWGNIQAGQGWAAAHAENNNEASQLCSDYPDKGVQVLDLRQHPRERIRWREPAVRAARMLKNRGAEGAHLGNLGLAYASLGDYRRAIEYHDQHLAITREVSDRRGESYGLINLGTAHYELREYERAVSYYDQALAISHDIGDRRGEAYGARGLGVAYCSLGEYPRAIGYHEQQLAISREIGDRRAEGSALGNLGLAYYSLGEHRRAIQYHEQRLAIAREIGDRQSESAGLWSMSLSLDKLGERKQAIMNAEAALKIREEIEDPNTAKVRAQLEAWRRE